MRSFRRLDHGEATRGSRRPRSRPLRSGGEVDRAYHEGQGPCVKVRNDLPTSNAQPSLRDAWVELLSRYEFQWFLTLTFKEEIHPEAAFKKFRMFVNHINRVLYGRRWMRRPHGGVYWVLALEWQKRGVLHFHGLMGDVEDLNARIRRLDCMDYWKEIAGFAKIEEVKNFDAVNRYVSKYVIKRGEIDLSENLGSYAEQISVFRSQ